MELEDTIKYPTIGISYCYFLNLRFSTTKICSQWHINGASVQASNFREPTSVVY